jgi:hypothetical protein
MPAAEDARHAWLTRGIGALTALALVAGFGWGALTIVRQYHRLLQAPVPPGPSATVDWFLQSAGLGTSEELLIGVALARLPDDVDVAYVAPVSGNSREQFWQGYYLAGYLLIPWRVWVIAWCEPPASAQACEPFPAVTDLGAAIAARGVHHLLVAGNQDVPLTYTRALRLSSSLTLLDLP